MRHLPTAIRTFLSSVPWQWIFDQEAAVEDLSQDSAAGARKCRHPERIGRVQGRENLQPLMS